MARSNPPRHPRARAAARWCAVAAALFVLLGCGTYPGGARYYHRHPPPPPVARAPVPIDQVLLSFAAMGEVVAWVAHVDDFRLVLPPGGPIRLTHRAVIGELRTADAAVSAETYRLLACGWAQGPQLDLPPEIAEPSRAREQCRGDRSDVARRVSSGVVAQVLLDLRARGARAGARLVEDVRCFMAVDLRRVWCEGVAVRGEIELPEAPPMTQAAAPPPALDPRAVRFAWRRAPGAEACADGAEIAREVVRRVGRDPFRANGARLIEGECRAAPGGWEARITARDPDGRARGERVLRVEGASCAPLARQAALAVAVAVDE